MHSKRTTNFTTKVGMLQSSYGNKISKVRFLSDDDMHLTSVRDYVEENSIRDYAGYTR